MARGVNLIQSKDQKSLMMAGNAGRVERMGSVGAPGAKSPLSQQAT